jgi:hypothetical protein
MIHLRHPPEIKTELHGEKSENVYTLPLATKSCITSEGRAANES